MQYIEKPKNAVKLQFVALCEHIMVAHEEILHGKLPAASFHCFLTHVMQHDRCNVAKSKKQCTAGNPITLAARVGGEQDMVLDTEEENS